MQVFITVIIIVILIALAVGLVNMVKGGKQGSDRLFKSLVIRVALSVLLFLLVLFAAYMGWIEPNTVRLDAPKPQ